MVTNETEYSRLEPKSIIKISVAEKYKPLEIYRRIWDMYG